MASLRTPTVSALEAEVGSVSLPLKHSHDESGCDESDRESQASTQACSRDATPSDRDATPLSPGSDVKTSYPGSDATASHQREYDQKASMYESYRGPSPGWDVMSPLLEHIAGKRVLDLGCGTGAFFDRVLSKKPAELVGYDPSASMIEKAQEKADAYAAAGHVHAGIPVSCHCADTADLPAGHFDVVLCLQVVQNICADPAEGRGEAARLAFLREINRLLAPGGMAIITTRYRKPLDAEPEVGGGSNVSRSTYGDMYWYADKAVVPKAVKYMEDAVPQSPVEELVEAGFEGCTLQNSVDTVIRRDAYLQAALLSDASFRSADSFFSRLDTSELEALQRHVRGLEEKGELQGYVSSRDNLRAGLGHVAVVVGYTPK